MFLLFITIIMSTYMLNGCGYSCLYDNYQNDNNKNDNNEKDNII